MERASLRIQAALVRAGLYEDEAKAMVDTWKVSYFKTPGLRILYVLPRAETDELLPLHIQPAPKSIERVLVGRIEVMTGEEEQSLLGKLVTSNSMDGSFDPFSLGRFAEPRLQRVKALAVENSDLLYTIESLISRLN